MSDQAPDRIDSRAADERRKELKQAYRTLFEDVTELFARHDPLDLVAIGAPRDDYEPEVGTILPRVMTLHGDGQLTAAAARQVIYEEFVQWFSPDIAGPIERFGPVAEDLLAFLDRD